MINVLASFIIIACGLLIVATILLYPAAAIFGGVTVQQFAKAVAPVQIVGFGTRSSLASLPATFVATKALGISDRVSCLVLPIAVTLFKYASPIARTTGTYFVASLYGIELGFLELLIIVSAISLLSVYAPGIPSGGLLIMAPVYVSLGLPIAGIGILIAVDLIVDMFITVANVTANVAATTVLSRDERQGEINKQTITASED